MVCVASLFVPVVFAIDLVDNLEVDIALVEEGILMELVEMEKCVSGKATIMFVGMNLH